MVELGELKERVLKLNGFSDFNEMQKIALKKNLFEKNIVISAPTASGKTLIAELVALRTILNEKKIVVFSCPLKALASEHFSEFKKKYASAFGVNATISTGDFDSNSGYLEKFDLIFCTNEKLDSLFRHKADWLKKIGLVIVDEIHEIDSDRGPVIEFLLMKFFFSGNPRIIALSATIPNAIEIAEWLDAELIESGFRPVKLSEGVFFDNTLLFPKETGIVLDGENELEKIVADTMRKGKQCLIFCNTRKSSMAIAKKISQLVSGFLSHAEKNSLKRFSDSALNALEQPTEQCKLVASLIEKGVCFHNAGLLAKQRKTIEDSFRNGLLKVISATPTLAAGVNLPAFRVIITSLHRYDLNGLNRISVREYKQTCLPYNTKIITKEKGIIEIGKIVESKLPLSVLSFNLEELEQEFEPIVNYFKSEQKSLIKFFLKNGEYLSITPNHPILFLKNKSFNWVPAENLRVGNSVLILKKQLGVDCQLPYFFEQLPEEAFVLNCGKLFAQAKQVFETEKKLAEVLGINSKRIYHWKKDLKAMPLKIAVKLCDLLNYSKEERAKLFTCVKSDYGNKMKLPTTLTKNFLWLVGFIATDGNLNKVVDKRTNSEYINIRVFNTNNNLIKKAEECFEELGISFSKSKQDDGLITLEAGATLLARILQQHYGLKYNNKTTSVEVPFFLENAADDMIGAYLGGVFDGDGNFNIINQKRGKNSKHYRVLIVTSSKKFAIGLCRLLHKIGITPTLENNKKKFEMILKNRLAVFSKPRYNIIIRKIEYLKAFSQFAMIHKAKINIDYSTYHNLTKRDKSNLAYELCKIQKIQRIKNSKKVYNISVKGNENYFANNVLVHNCGRAGRPRYDEKGESIVLCKNERHAEQVLREYVFGKMEEVVSRLSFEPVLRMHVLSAIADGFVFDLASLEEFFGKSFFAFQYQNLSELNQKIMNTLKELNSMGFIELNKDEFKPTLLGKRVSELFLDPLSAFQIIKALQFPDYEKLSDFSYLFLACNTSELFPYVSVPQAVENDYWADFQNKANCFLCSQEELYNDFFLLQKFATASLLSDWIEEKTEQEIIKEFNVLPGILRNKLEIVDWLLYSATELAKVLGISRHNKNLLFLRKRVKNGVREELLPLIELRNIGRIRARKLFISGYKTINDLKKADVLDLERVLGKAIALGLKKQLGEKIPLIQSAEETKQLQLTDT